VGGLPARESANASEVPYFFLNEDDDDNLAPAEPRARGQIRRGRDRRAAMAMMTMMTMMIYA